MKYSLICLILIFNLTLFAEIIWDNFYDPFNADQYTIEPNMVISQDSSFMLIGESWFEWWPGEWYCDGIILKINNDGELIWISQESIDGISDENIRPKDIIELDDNNIICAGRLIWPEIGYISKRDSYGNILWSSTSDLRTNRILRCNDGNIILIGSLDNNAAIRKINNDGNEIWTCIYELGDHSSDIRDAVRISDSDFAFFGHKIDDYPDHDTFVFRTNSIGDTLWTSISDEGCWDFANKIIKSSDNHLFIFKSNNSGPNIIELDLNGNILDEYISNDLYYFYAINLNNENCFLSTSVIGYNYSITKFNYDFNIEWMTTDFLRHYKELSIGDFIFYHGSQLGIHLIKTDNDLVGIEQENITSQNTTSIFCFPNPFNPETTISFSVIQTSSFVTLEIYNLKGQKVKQLVNEQLPAGQHSVVWNGTDGNNQSVSSGIYFYKLSVKGKTESVKKCLLLK